MLSYWGLMTAALTAVMVALALMGPALLPPAWLNGQLAVMAALSFVLGWVARPATGRWWRALLWVAWVLTAVQWGWSAGEQPSGLPYWLAGMLLGGIGAALGRPRPAALTPRRVVKREPLRPTEEHLVDEQEREDAWTDEPLTPDSWTAPLSAPTPPAAAVPSVPVRAAAQAPARVEPAPSQSLPPRRRPEAEVPQVRAPAWAAETLPSAEAREPQPTQPTQATWGTASLWEQSQPSGSGQPPAAPAWAAPHQPVVPPVEVEPPASQPPRGQTAHAWQGRTWWDLEDELDTVDEAEWAAAEALLRPQRGPGGSSRTDSSRRGQRTPQPNRAVQQGWEDIEDRD